MTAKKKAPKKKAPPAAAKPYSAQDPGEKKFLKDTYDQTLAQAQRIEDKAKRAEYTTRLKRIRAKFNALPKNKVTQERVQRYMEEITKTGQEIALNPSYAHERLTSLRASGHFDQH